MSNDVREKIAQWLTGADTCFLLGAGCSKCAGKPLIDDLTKITLDHAEDGLKARFKNLKPEGGRCATVEDLMTYLIRYRSILESTSGDDDKSITVADIDTWLNYIKKKLVARIADDWRPNSCHNNYHRKFLKRLRNHRQPRDIFSLNYDTVLESSLEDLRTPYVDGFRGANRAWFDPPVFDEKAEYRIFKLHGSVNWIRDSDSYIRRVSDTPKEEEPVVVYPTEQKYIQTQYGVYETLMAKFRERLRIPKSNNTLVVLGYSFSDEHINEAICDSVRGSNLTVISFVGPEPDHDAQKRRLEKLESRCDSRFNAFVGGVSDGYLVGNAADSTLKDTILEKELWQFENMVDLVAGGES